MKIQEHKLKEASIYEQQNVIVQCPINSSDNVLDLQESQESVDKYFSIKTIQVKWEGNTNSFMHVFIDTTDIVRLEEANNSIRCQKIMFASASHEFRTPLNAIINSFQFIDRGLKSIKEIESSTQTQDSIRLIDTQIKQISRFVKMGSSSSILLLSLIEDILDLSKIEGGRFHINKAEGGIKDIVDEVRDIFEFQCKQK